MEKNSSQKVVIPTGAEGGAEESLTTSPRSKTTLFFLLILVFSAAVRVFLSIYPKTAFTYNDELFNLELSQNLFLRGSLTVYGAPVHFTKLLYPLLLSPFYAVSDGILRTRLISAFNAVLISSALIPGYLLARRILKKQWQVIAAVLFLALSPNLFLSMSFMAENLYYPLLLWCFYAAYRFFTSETKKPLHAFLLGVLALLLYFTKEIGAAFTLALAVALAAGGKGNKKSRREVFLPLGCYLLGIILPWILLHLTLLRGMGYTYASLFSFRNTPRAPETVFLIHSIGTALLWFLISVLWFPVALPLAHRKKMSSANKNLLLLSAVYAGAIALCVGFGVSFQSGTPDVNPHICLRFFLGAAFPFLLLTFTLQEEAEPVTRKSVLLRLSVAFICLVVLFLAFPQTRLLTDSPALRLLLQINTGSALWLWLCKGALIAGIVVFLWLWNKKRKQAFACLLSLLLVLEGGSAVLYAHSVKNVSAADPALLNETKQLDEYLDTVEGNTLILAETANDPVLRQLNTVLNDDYAFMTFHDARSLFITDSKIALDSNSIPVSLRNCSGNNQSNLDHIDQIITIGKTPLADCSTNQEITPENMSSVHIYLPKDPNYFALREPLDYIPGETITFYGNDPSFISYQPGNFGDPESGWTWTNSYIHSLTLKPVLDAPRDLTAYWSWVKIQGEKQPCAVYANDTLVYESTISSDENNLSFIIPFDAWHDSGALTLRFVFSHAVASYNDPRILAMAFESLRLE